MAPKSNNQSVRRHKQVSKKVKTVSVCQITDEICWFKKVSVLNIQNVFSPKPDPFFFNYHFSRSGGKMFWMFKNETFLNHHISAVFWHTGTVLTFLENSLCILTLWLLLFGAIRSSSSCKLLLKLVKVWLTFSR